MCSIYVVPWSYVLGMCFVCFSYVLFVLMCFIALFQCVFNSSCVFSYVFNVCVCGLDTFSYVSSVCMFLRVFPLVSGSFYVFLLCPVCFSYALCVFVTN